MKELKKLLAKKPNKAQVIMNIAQACGVGYETARAWVYYDHRKPSRSKCQYLEAWLRSEGMEKYGEKAVAVADLLRRLRDEKRHAYPGWLYKGKGAEKDG